MIPWYRPVVFLVAALTLFVWSFVVFRKVVRVQYFRNKRLGNWATILEVLVFFLHCMMGWAILPADWPAVQVGMAWAWAGWLVIGIGVFATLISFWWLGWFSSLGQETDRLVQDGPYRWMRNPQLVLYGLVVFACVILWPSWYLLGWAFLYVVIAHLMVKTEEEHLNHVYSREYARYCRKVPRYLPLGAFRDGS
jgi:protein-S-isoprenylcysteine O-methyltransferase Ste14